MSKKRYRIILLIIFFSVIFIIFGLVLSLGISRKDRNIIGIIMTGEIDENGWNQTNYEGIKSLCDKQDIKLIVKENVPEYSGKCENAIKELADSGAKLIILSSYSYADEVKDVLSDYPDVKFISSSADCESDNYSAYNARFYQARFLTGIVAGFCTKSNQIGYVAAMQNNEVNRGINAFTIGVRKVNPEATVHVMFTDSWDNREKECELVDYLIDVDNADVISYHQNQDNVARECEKRGVYFIGYNQELSKQYDKCLVSTVCNWEDVFEEVLTDSYRNKNNKTELYWVGIEKNAVNIGEFSDDVSLEIRKVVNHERETLFLGKDVFSGLIYDNNGNLRCDENENISDEELFKHMDWYVMGVELDEK